jgi:hypothetical protein
MSRVVLWCVVRLQFRLQNFRQPVATSAVLAKLVHSDLLGTPPLQVGIYCVSPGLDR